MSKNNLHVLFDDDDILLDAIKKIKEKKHHINEVYTPFPVHGLDKALGLKPTRISILAFISLNFCLLIVPLESNTLSILED